MPMISVIVPVYRVEKYIHRCVDSILAQTYDDFELILVDDGSPDNCGAICDEYAAKDSRVVVIHQQNGGLSAARNAGIDWAFAHSDSQWITFIDSDDFVHREYLHLLLEAVHKCGTYISGCGLTSDSFVDIPADYLPAKLETEEAYSNPEWGFRAVITCAKLYYKELWDDIRFPVGKIHEDRFTTHKLLFQVPEVANAKLPLYFYTINPNGITHSQWTPKRLDDFEAVEEQLQFFKERNLHKAYTRTAQSGFYVAYGMIQEIQQASESVVKYANYIRMLKKKLRRYLWLQKKKLDVSQPDSCFAYEEAYPSFMKLYWYWIALCRKLKIKE